MPGDFARIEPDNKVTLLGRGSNCVNTGGEKVYPEEVEMAIKAHPAVYDASSSGSPTRSTARASPRWCSAGTARPRPRGVREFLRACLSGYKLPRALTVVAEIPRDATGKAQYPRAKEMALANRTSQSGAGAPV